MRTQTGRWRLASATLVVGIAFALVAGGCASGSGNDTSAGGDSAGAPAGADKDQARGEFEAGQADAAGAPKAGGGAPVKVAPAKPSIVYTGSMTVRVEKVDQAADEAGRIATGAGGMIGSDKRTIDEDRSEATVVLRVPADRFASTLTALAGLGREESRELQQQDVTEAVIDLDARITSQQASVNRVRTLLAQAKTIGEVVSVEAELTRREADLASLEARKRNLTDLVELSTITLHLRGPAAEVVDDDPDTGFLAGLRSGWDAFVASVDVLLTVLGAILPFVLIIGLPLWALVWFARRRHLRPDRPRPAVATSYGLPPAPPETGGPNPGPAKPDPTAPKSTVD